MTACDHLPKTNNSRRVAIALLLNVVMMVIEFFVAFWTNSQAVLASAIHDFGDSMALAFSIGLQLIAAKKANDRYPFGYGRFELSAGLSAGILIFCSNMFVFYEVSMTLLKNVSDRGTTLSTGMVFVAILGIVINFVAFKLMHAEHSQHERTLSLHFFEDTANWMAVLLGGVVIYFFHWKWIDSILALFIAGIVSFRIVKVITHHVGIFLQRTPPQFELKLLREELQKISGMLEVLEVKIWSLDGTHHVANISAIANDLRVKKEVQEICKKFHVIELFLDLSHPS